MGRLENKVAIVTGGAQGQGAAIVRAFVAEGAKVMIADIAVAAGEELAAELGTQVTFAKLDVSDEANWQEVVTATEAKFGAINILANNAGILAFNSIVDTEVSEFEKLFRVNQMGTFLGMKSVIPAMKRAGGGSIVNCSSVEGLAGMPFLISYTGTKFAIRGMTKSAALELGPEKIRVNSIHPGMIDTAMTAIAGEEGMKFAANRVALKRVGLPEDVAGAYVFLASDEAAFITGAELAVDGGATATHAFGG